MEISSFYKLEQGICSDSLDKNIFPKIVQNWLRKNQRNSCEEVEKQKDVNMEDSVDLMDLIDLYRIFNKEKL